MEKLHKQTQLCMRCGFCLEVCPVYSTMRYESYGPRGRMTLLREVLDGKLKLTEGVKTRFVLCTNCGRCQAVCLKLINLSDAFATINMYIKDGVLEDRVSEYLKGKRKNGKTI